MCRSMVAMMDVNKSGKLGLEEFKTLMCEIAKWRVSFCTLLCSNYEASQIFYFKILNFWIL